MELTKESTTYTTSAWVYEYRIDALIENLEKQQQRAEKLRLPAVQFSVDRNKSRRDTFIVSYTRHDEREYRLIARDPSDPTDIALDRLMRDRRAGCCERAGDYYGHTTDLEGVIKAHPERIAWATAYEVTVTRTLLKIGDWTLRGMIRRIKSGDGTSVTQVTSYGDAILPERFVESKNEDWTCDHCKRKANRTRLYIIESDGEWRQIGTSCVTDFTGHAAPEHLVESEAWASPLEGEGDAAPFPAVGGGSSRSKREYAVRDRNEFLAAAAAAIEGWGWHPSRCANDGCRNCNSAIRVYTSTWRIAMDGATMGRVVVPSAYGKSLPAASFKITDAHRQQAANALAWLRSRPESDIAASDFLRNLRAAVSMPVVDERLMPIAAALMVAERNTEVAAARSAQREQIAKENAGSEWVGEIGQRLDLHLRFDGSTGFDGDYGVWYLSRFTDEQGNKFVWKGGSASVAGEPGKWAKVRGTVKKHDEYLPSEIRKQQEQFGNLVGGAAIKQTVLSRCVIRWDEEAQGV